MLTKLIWSIEHLCIEHLSLCLKTERDELMSGERSFHKNGTLLIKKEYLYKLIYMGGEHIQTKAFSSSN